MWQHHLQIPQYPSGEMEAQKGAQPQPGMHMPSWSSCGESTGGQALVQILTHLVLTTVPVAGVRARSVTKLCPTPCNPLDCSPPGSSVHGISQARILEWVTVPFSRGSFRLRGLNHASPALAGGFFTDEPPGKPRYTSSFLQVEP